MKIPQYEQQVNTPNPPQFNQIADVRNNDLGTIVDGLSEVYKVKLKEEEEAKKTAIFQADTSIKIGLKKAQYDILEKIKNGGSYADAEMEYQKAHDSLVSQYSSAFDVDKTGNTKIRALTDYQESSVDNILKIRDAVNSRRKSDTVDSANNMMDILKNEYSYSTTSEQRKAMVEKMNSTMAGVSATGVMSPDEGKMKLRQAIGDAEVGRIKIMIQNSSNPYSALSDLEMSKDVIDPNSYVQLKNALESKIVDISASEKVGIAIAKSSDIPNFDFAVSSVFREEGGYVADDAGKGPTIYGINSSANKEEFAQIMALKNAGKEQEAIALAKQTYKTKYWDAINGDNLSPDLAYAAMDVAVNMGQGTAKKLLEQSGGDILAFQELRKQEYINIAKSNPEKAKYLAAWLARTDRVTNKVVAGAQIPKQEDVDIYYKNNIAPLISESPEIYESSIIDTATATGKVPTQIIKQANTFFNMDVSTITKADEATIASISNVVSKIGERPDLVGENGVSSQDVMKANILKSRIDSGATPQQAIMDMRTITKDAQATDLYKTALTESQNILIGTKASGEKIDKPETPRYANSDFMQSYAIHRSLGATQKEAKDLAQNEVNKSFGEFNGKLFKNVATEFDTRFSEESFIGAAKEAMASIGYVPPNGATFGVVADTITKKQYARSGNKNDITYAVMLNWSDTNEPVYAIDEKTGSVIRFKPNLKFIKSVVVGSYNEPSNSMLKTLNIMR